MLSVAEARARILEHALPLPEERVALFDAHRRVLSRDVTAKLTQPPFDTTAMDGYALRAADAALPLSVVGQSSAGHRFAGSVHPGQAVRIFTGAPLPAGADAVAPQEIVSREGDIIRIESPIEAGAFIRPRGLDFSESRIAMQSGHRLTDRDIALAAAMNHPTLWVRRKPIVALLPNGDELAVPGGAPGADQIIASSVYSVRAACMSAGAEVLHLGIARDRLDLITDRIGAARAAGADVLVTMGGASVGDHDLVKAAFERHGIELGFWQIAMRPGKPLIFGRIDGMAVLGLPGNPVSSYACTLLFLLPLLERLCGLPGTLPWKSGVLAAGLPANDHREDYLRSAITIDANGRLGASPHPVQDSSMQAVLAGSQGFVRRPPNAPPAKAGDPCDILLFPV